MAGYMNLEQVRQILFKETKRKGYVLEERPSTTTSSRYYIIRSGEESVEFRVSDHPGNTKMLTLRLDHRLNPESVSGFINNRIKALSYKRVMGLLK